MADPFDSPGWKDVDATWERLVREGKASLEDQDSVLAARRIGEARDVATRHFQVGDPRLAATLAYQAWLLRRQGTTAAAPLFQEALAHWSHASAWLNRQPSPRRNARSSSFHLRLETKHPGAYQRRRELEMRALLTQGRVLTECLRDRLAALDGKVFDTAFQEAEQAFDTYRKIIAAIQLLASARTPS